MHRQSFILAGFAALIGAPLAAQTTSFELAAQVAPVCGVYNSTGTTINVDFGALADVATDASVNVGAGSATYRCNSPAGFTRTIASQNNGFLTLGGDATTQDSRRIRFTIAHGGGSGLSFAARQLNAPVSRSYPRDTSWLNGQTGSVSFQAFGVRTAPGANGVAGTSVMAGTYRDTVTITVTAN